MTLSTFLDVAISLVFVFFTVSMFVSGLVELINALLEQRSKLLQLALRKILDAPQTQSLFNTFWNHPLVRVKRQRYFGADKPISYLSADSFSTVILDLLVPNPTAAPVGTKQSTHLLEQIRAVVTAPPATTPTSLDTLIDLVKPLLARSNTLAEFRANLERWYDGYMEQVSGWYKRYAQGVVWIVAALVTVVMNVDTVLITRRLFNDKDLRERLVAQAEQTAKTQTRDSLFVDTPDSTGSKARIRRIPRDAKFGEWLGKHNAVLDSTLRSGSALNGADSLNVQAAYVQYLQQQIDVLKLPIGRPVPIDEPWYYTVLGWILTVAALSFGAPFWFDVLIKLVNIRNTTRRPLSSAQPNSQ